MQPDDDSSRHSRRRFLAGASAFTAGLGSAAILACGGDSKTPDEQSSANATGSTTQAAELQPQRGGTLRGGAVGDLLINTGFPWAYNFTVYFPTYASMETLIRYRDSLKPELVMAERYEYNADRTKLIVALKSGVEFHTGANVTVEDIFFSLDALAEPAKYKILGTPPIAAFGKYITARKKIDDRTMEFTFDKPRGNIDDFFAQLSVTQASEFDKILSGEAIVGTGPYVFKKWTPKTSFSFAPNRNWHDPNKTGGPYLDAIEVRVFLDQEAGSLAFQAGDTDILYAINPNLAKPFRDKGLVRVRPKAGLLYLGLNVTNPSMQDARIRQALSLAIDRKRLLDEAYEGIGTVTRQLWPPSSPAFDPSLESAGYDPAKARDLLRQAGFRQSAPFRIEYSQTFYPQQAAIIQQNFDAVGVKVELVPEDIPTFSGQFLNRQIKDMWILTGGSSALTPVSALQADYILRVPNVSYFETSEYVALIDRLSGLPADSPEAKSLYQRFNAIFSDDPWIIPLSGSHTTDLLSKQVKGLDKPFIAPAQGDDYGSLWLSK